MNKQANEAVLLVGFSYSLTEEQLAAGARDFAENAVPAIDGLKWKIFLNRPEKKRAGGIYLFRDAQAAESYVNGPYLQKLRQSPDMTDFSVEIFETLIEASVEAQASTGASAA